MFGVRLLRLPRRSSSRHVKSIKLYSAIERRLDIGPSPIVVNEQGLLVEWIAGETLYEGLELDDDLLKTLISGAIWLIPRDCRSNRFSFTARVDHYWLQLDAVHKTEACTKIYQEWRVAQVFQV